MTRLEKIAQKAVKEKAAKLLNTKVSNIIRVVEGYNGASVECRNGNKLVIPHEHWVG